VKLDGIDYKQIHVKSLRSQIGYVGVSRGWLALVPLGAWIQPAARLTQIPIGFIQPSELHTL
jgi:hypothetical protein